MFENYFSRKLCPISLSGMSSSRQKFKMYKTWLNDRNKLGVNTHKKAVFGSKWKLFSLSSVAPPHPWNLLVWHDVYQLSVAVTTQMLTDSTLKTQQHKFTGYVMWSEKNDNKEILVLIICRNVMWTVHFCLCFSFVSHSVFGLYMYYVHECLAWHRFKTKN